MRPDLHINQENTQTSVDLLLKKRLWDSWWQRRGFHTKVLYQKVVFVNQGVFLCEFSSGRRLHTRKTKKWVSVRKLALWPEDVKWQRELQLDAAAVLWGGVLNLVTPFLHLQLWKSSAYSSFLVLFMGLCRETITASFWPDEQKITCLSFWFFPL